jgi:AraC family transcriptional regulator
MKPRIIYKPAFTVIGIWHKGRTTARSVDALWERLGERFAEIPGVDPDQGYGVHVRNGDEEKYLAGLMARKGVAEGKIPDGMSLLNIQAHAYAVFHHVGRFENLDSTLQKIFSKWLQASGYQIGGDFFFETFDDRFQPDSDGSLLFIYVPVKESEGQ